MDPFGKAAWMVLLAGCACLPFVGCSNKPAERFETYNRLKKESTAESSANRGSADKADGGPVLTPTSTPKPVPAVPTAARKTAPASVPVAQTTASAPVPARVPKSSPASPSSGADAPGGVYQASVASTVTGTIAAPGSNRTLTRKVQLLVPNRVFKSEGPEGACRVSYDDIDLLKVLNMDPVPPNVGTLMPGWLKGLEGRRIRIRGFMYPTFQQTGVRAFGLARDNQICCFGGNPKIYDLFDVMLRDRITTEYIPNRPIDVVGVFHIRPEADAGKLYHLYEMDDATVITK
jgi:hypothetical protein